MVSCKQQWLQGAIVKHEIYGCNDNEKNRKLGSQILLLEHPDIHELNLGAFFWLTYLFALDIHPRKILSFNISYQTLTRSEY